MSHENWKKALYDARLILMVEYVVEFGEPWTIQIFFLLVILRRKHPYNNLSLIKLKILACGRKRIQDKQLLLIYLYICFQFNILHCLQTLSIFSVTKQSPQPCFMPALTLVSKIAH